ncbi:protoporphyrinogen/coproporphyrinogen oxidase [Vibrio splendidus]|uniref:protoporphyrinogen/coproporphyrinogen oxidase n=1 Tax=Vibrio splendidus TaxID=29497 RepID=UPI000D37E479|nr:FAD-dependent oxidoreductase [Vibrio splendidus]PTO78182.1 LPS biosynthesis protein [Vibrio splendidus]
MNIIIGAGISGLSYAAFSNEDYLILEASNEIGGYCKTTKRNDFTWDYAGHFFHFKEEEIKEFVFSRLREQKIHDVDKITKIKYKNNYIDFPFQKNIHQLSKEEYIECLIGLIERDEGKDCSSFKDMILQKFGEGICNKFLIPYNEKLYSIDLNRLDKDAMGRFFPYADLDDIILNAKSKGDSSYNSKFLYPEGGAIEFVNAINSEVDQSKILFNKKVVSICNKNKTVTTADGDVYHYNKLINTAPLPKLYKMCSVEFDSSIYSSNYVSVFNIGFDKKTELDHHWVYFPDKETIFYRIGYYNNILSEDKMSLYIELGHNYHSKGHDIDILFKDVIRDLKLNGIITDQSVVDWQYIKMDPAYVHINAKSEEDKTKKLQALNRDDIYSIGRYGSWTYCSIEDNIIEAKELAKQHEK